MRTRLLRCGCPCCLLCVFLTPNPICLHACSYKPKQLCKSKELVREVVTRLCAMASEPAPADLLDEDTQLPPAKMATQVRQ